MDNIAHSITAVALTTICLKNTNGQKYIWRFLFVALLVVNLPDFDFVVAFIERELYYEHHRGYTHSIIGGLSLVPLGSWLIKRIYKVIDLPWKTAFITSFVLWFVGHFTLDYFTVYGIQIFWPIDTTHYDYAMMFIIDLIVWAVGFTFITLYCFKRFNKVKLSYMFIGFLTVLYSAYFVQKQYIIYDFKNNYNVADVHYNVFINPFYSTTVYGFDNNNRLIQVSYRGFTSLKAKGINTTTDYPYISDKYTINALPNNGEYNEVAKRKLKRYIKFGRIIGCEPITNGALCQSFKYFRPSVKSKWDRPKTLSKTIRFDEN